MEQQPDLYREQRETVLKIFATAEKGDFATAESEGVVAAFNKAASFIEQTPGIVEYTNWDRQANTVQATDGTDFRGALSSIMQHSANAEVRARAAECLGNISTRHFDYMRSLYDLEQLSHVAVRGPTAAVKGAALQAFAKIATNRQLKQANPTTQHFQNYESRGGGPVDFRSSVFPHYSLNTGGKSAWDLSSPIDYVEAAVGLAAHVAGKHWDVEARRMGAETLRFLALQTQEDRFTDYRDPRSLVFHYVQRMKETEQDATVQATFKKIIEIDPMLAEKQRARSIGELADTLTPSGGKKPGAHGFTL